MVKRKNVTIILPKYHPKKKIFDKVKEYLKKNAGNAEIIEVDGSMGLSHAYNEGIKKSHGEIVVTLHQDCIPTEKDSLNKLIEPFSDSDVVLTYSLLLQKDTGEIFFPHVPDGKFTAFRKSALERVGMFDEKNFFTGGEDVDIWLKLKKIGTIIRVDTVVLHDHPGYRKNKTLEKRRQSGNINGTLFRIWGIKNPKWIKALICCVIWPLSYGKYYIKGFVSSKQKYRRYE